MKKNKVIMTVICAVVLTVITASGAYAAMAGDIDGSGAPEAEDARTILRAAVRLDELEGDNVLIADVNGDGEITSADARSALRMAVKLEDLRPYYIRTITKEPTCDEVNGDGIILFTTTEKDFVTASGEKLPNEYTVTVKGGHIWSKPTCTEDSVCSRCGEHGEKALGHTTSFGICDRCRGYQNPFPEKTESIKSFTDEGRKNILEGRKLINQSSKAAASWLPYFTEDAKPFYEAAMKNYKDAAAECEGVPELEKYKKQFEAIIAEIDKIIVQSDKIIALTENDVNGQADNDVNDSNYFDYITPLDEAQWAIDDIYKVIYEDIRYW